MTTDVAVLDIRLHGTPIGSLTRVAGDPLKRWAER